MGDTPTLEAVDEFIAARHRALTFPPWLESQFEADTRKRRSQRLRAAMFPNAIIYNLFLIPDWFLIRDQFWFAVVLHAAVVTPWILLAGWLAGTQPSRILREGATASIPVAIALQILWTFVLTSSPDADHYQYFVLLVVLFTNTIQRLPYRFALVVSILIVSLQCAAIASTGHLTGAAAFVAVSTLMIAAYLTLISNYYLERDFRRAYLHSLRDRLWHARIDRASKHDALTELANRHFLDSRLSELWAHGDDGASPVAVIMLDIDHFKAFNDRYGHLAGDACLKRVAACLTAELRSGEDLAVRYGGEELMALLPKTDTMQGAQVAERIRRSIEALGIPHAGSAGRGIVTASLGVAAGPVSTLTAAEIIAAADSSLYAAKRNGRNQVWPRLLRTNEDNPGAVVITMAR
jgi:diguanylate cyclase (GGDEF)-like protein